MEKSLTKQTYTYLKAYNMQTMALCTKTNTETPKLHIYIHKQISTTVHPLQT